MRRLPALVPARLLAVLTAFLEACALAPAPERRSPPAAPEAGTFRVMTLNMQSGLAGLSRVAAAIEEARPDLVALQEVDAGTLRSGGVDQAAWLARRTGMPFAHHVRTTQLFGGAYGIAVLSRLPVLSVDDAPLPGLVGLEPRRFVRIVVDVDGTPLSVYATHLSHLPQQGRLRATQARTLLGAIERDPNPALLLGDLNDVTGSAALELLTRELTDVFGAVGDGPGGTYPLPVPLGPAVRIDYVLASRDLVPRRAFVLDRACSDHRALLADLERPGPVVRAAARRRAAAGR